MVGVFIVDKIIQYNTVIITKSVGGLVCWWSVRAEKKIY
jgi:hypothetical protein